MDAAAGAGPLDESAFRHFAPLLAASQEYARHSGCRFRSSSFDGLPAGRAPAEPRLAAKVRAAATVRDFAGRLRAGEPGLTEEMDRAYRVVMSESVRNAMIGMFQALEMFPPSPPPPGVEEEDCCYEDVAAPLPVIAQRLYNDQVRRLSDTTGGPNRLERRAMTAAFLVDFAEGAGVQLPPMPETQQGMLKDFATRTSEFSQGRSPGEQQRARDVFLGALGRGAVAERLRQEVQKWWAENWQAVLWTAAGAAVVGAAALAGALLAKRSRGPPEEEREGGGR